MSTGGELLIESLIAWGVDTIFGMPGDGINGVMEAIRNRQRKIRFIQVRHEESAALMACAHAKFTGKIGCCLATTGPGGIHLLNGLYDAKYDRAPVIALTGLPYHDLVDTFTQQDVDHTKLFADVAAYSSRVMSAAHVENAVALACRMAVAARGVAHLAIPTDVQDQELEDVESSPRNVAHHVSLARSETRSVPPDDELDRAAEILRSGRRIAILAGQGALGAKAELLQLADTLGAPIIKALLGKALVPDDHPLTTGGIGLLGTRPSQEALEECDTVLIVGSTFPYVEYYPKPGQARGIQIDSDPSRIGLRFPVELGLAGDSKIVLQKLLQRLERRADRSFLESAQQKVAAWRDLLHRSAPTTGALLPGRLAIETSRQLKSDAIVVWDSGHNTGTLARYVDAQEGQMWGGSGLMATMGCGIPYAIAAALAFPGRQVVAFVGDGGLTMLLGELATITRYHLPIKIVVMKNNTLGQIKWEQMLFLGNPEYECDLQPIDFAGVAQAMGIRGFSVSNAEECRGVLEQAFAERGAALVEGLVDPDDPLLPPKRNEQYVKNLEHALHSGMPNADKIEQMLHQSPAREMLQP